MKSKYKITIIILTTHLVIAIPALISASSGEPNADLAVLFAPNLLIPLFLFALLFGGVEGLDTISTFMIATGFWLVIGLILEAIWFKWKQKSQNTDTAPHSDTSKKFY